MTLTKSANLIFILYVKLLMLVFCLIKRKLANNKRLNLP
mgnify:CR=1 FL=1